MSASKRRQARRLTIDIEKNLLAYAAAAGAVIFSTAPADAEIIYTPSNTPMTVAQANKGPALTQLDLTNHGAPDFTFLMSSTLGFHSTTFSATTTRRKFLLKVDPAVKGNQAVQGQPTVTASAIPAGVTIGPQEKFGEGGLYMRFKSSHIGGSRSSGSWQKVEYAYVGLKFLINGKVHYGWARIKFPFPNGVKLPSIYGYAYESTPNTPIVTGQTSGSADQTQKAAAPASLGTLAAGASAIDLRRSVGSASPAP